ncbi:hypothetical protein Y032_0862g2742 [Ancylostoma ceylanicum]|nr:hypothetical protein Y032_0862g2742 [Ancylostoma ceylanicum]
MKLRDRTVLKYLKQLQSQNQISQGLFSVLLRYVASHQLAVVFKEAPEMSVLYRGANLYVIPFCLGPIGGRYSINAVQLTDSAFVVLNMRVITRVSSAIWDAIGQADFVRCIHSVGRPRPITARLKSNWMCNTDQYFLAQRLAENDVSVLDSCCIYS